MALLALNQMALSAPSGVANSNQMALLSLSLLLLLLLLLLWMDSMKVGLELLLGPR